MLYFIRVQFESEKYYEILIYHVSSFYYICYFFISLLLIPLYYLNFYILIYIVSAKSVHIKNFMNFRFNRFWIFNPYAFSRPVPNYFVYLLSTIISKFQLTNIFSRKWERKRQKTGMLQCQIWHFNGLTKPLRCK